MSRQINIPKGKEIKPLLGAYLLKGGRSYEIPENWHLPSTYTDGTLIDWGFSEEPVKKEESFKKPAKKAKKPVKKKENHLKKEIKEDLEGNDA